MGYMCYDCGKEWPLSQMFNISLCKICFIPHTITVNKEHKTMVGKIARLFPEKNFGFINNGVQDFFFHRSALQDGSWDALYTGQAVEFDGDASNVKGPRAENVSVKAY